MNAMLKPEPERPSRATIADRLDRVIAVMSPEWAAKRQATRMAMDVKARWYHRSADFNRARKNWRVQDVTPDTANLNELETIRGRSDDLMRNNGIAAGTINTMQFNVVGTGPSPQSRIDFETVGITKEEATAKQRVIDRNWLKYTRNVSNDERLSFWELLIQASNTTWIKGECFLIKRYRKRPGSDYVTCWQLVEPERVRNPYGTPNSATMRDGIELGPHGQPIRYHIANATPGDLYADWSKAYETVPIDAFDKNGRPNVLHYYHKKAPGQTHGVPLLSPVMDVFEHLNGYMESEWVRNRVAACFAAFIKRAGEAGDLAQGNSSYTSAGERHEVLKPGTIQYLNDGEEITFANANIPGSQFDPFVTKTLQFIGAGVGMPAIEMILKDLSKSNYSSMRAGFLDARKMFKTEAQLLKTTVQQPVREAFIDEQVLRGEVVFRKYERFRHEYTFTQWTGHEREWVDPLNPMKEVQALVLAKDNNLTTLSEIYSDADKNWDEQLSQRALEHDMEEELGILPVASTAKPPMDNAGEETTDNSEDPPNGEDKTKTAAS